MKKEIEITFEKDGNVANLGVNLLVCGKVFDVFKLGKEYVHVGLDVNSMRMLGIEKPTLESYLTIPEIKALYDEHFKKEVDLFWFIDIQNKLYYISCAGNISLLDCRNNDGLVSQLKKHYNAFPSNETCANAIPMSLDERKQYLFALAKGYEVLTRDEALGIESYSLYFDGEDKSWSRYARICDRTSNINFKEERHTLECADWMNGSEVSE